MAKSIIYSMESKIKKKVKQRTKTSNKKNLSIKQGISFIAKSNIKEQIKNPTTLKLHVTPS